MTHSPTPTNADDVTVIQADREAFKELRGMFGPRVERMVDDGDFDTDWQMLLLARHRIAHQSNGDVERLREALRDMLDMRDAHLRGNVHPKGELQVVANARAALVIKGGE